MTSKYDLILLDLDDTLIDFQKSERISFLKTLHQLELEISNHEEVYVEYRRVSLMLWDQHERGEISQMELRERRYSHIVDKFSIDCDPLKLSAKYLDQLKKNIVVYESTLPTLTKLKEVAELGIVTNGVKEVQNPKINDSGIHEHIEFVVMSVDVGHPKPHSKIFEHAIALSKSKPSKDRILMVGDRIEADILGATRFGIDSCWINPEDRSNDHPEAKVTYRIKDIGELPAAIS